MDMYCGCARGVPLPFWECVAVGLIGGFIAYTYLFLQWARPTRIERTQRIVNWCGSSQKRCKHSLLINGPCLPNEEPASWVLGTGSKERSALAAHDRSADRCAHVVEKPPSVYRPKHTKTPPKNPPSVGTCHTQCISALHAGCRHRLFAHLTKLDSVQHADDHLCAYARGSTYERLRCLIVRKGRRETKHVA